MKKLFVLPLALVCLFGAAGSALAQSATLTATVRVNPLKVEVTAPGVVTVGEWFDIKAEVSNLGTERISRAFATLNTSPEINVRGNVKKRFGSLPPGGTKTIKWRVKVDSPGNYIVTVEAKGNLAGEEIVASDTDTISATGSLGAFLFRLIFGA
ncbi:hypothetical protein IID21_03895 [Patescibacteria group bacterium]|nr:hypothetical protein [Patescibacteria group bacterium]